jgi:hypothetical protein
MTRFKKNDIKLKLLKYGTYPIIKQIEVNTFKLGPLPCMGNHLVFNVDSLKLCKPSMLDGDKEKSNRTLIPNELVNEVGTELEEIIVCNVSKHPYKEPWIFLRHN